MAGPLDTGQEIATHLLLHIIPLLLYHLVYLVLPEDPMSFRFLAKTIAQTSAWRLRGHPRDARPKRFKCFKKPKKKMVSNAIQDMTIKQKLPVASYLVPAFFTAFKVGCCIKNKIRNFRHPIQRAPRFLALQGAFLDNPAVRFDSDSFSIGIDNHASRCMANAPHLFEDLHLIDNAGEVIGIGEGLAIKGKGMLKFSIEDNNGKIHHTIKIPNSLYLPGLSNASCHHNIGRRRQETGKHGWGILSENECSIGMGEARKQSCLTQLPTHQYSPRLRHPTRIACSLLPSRLLRLLTTERRLSCSILAAIRWTTNLRSFLKNSLPKKISITTRICQSMRGLMQTMTR